MRSQGNFKKIFPKPSKILNLYSQLYGMNMYVCTHTAATSYES